MNVFPASEILKVCRKKHCCSWFPIEKSPRVVLCCAAVAGYVQRATQGSGWAGWTRQRKVRKDRLLPHPVRKKEAATQVSGIVERFLKNLPLMLTDREHRYCVRCVQREARNAFEPGAPLSCTVFRVPHVSQVITILEPQFFLFYPPSVRWLHFGL